MPFYLIQKNRIWERYYATVDQKIKFSIQEDQIKVNFYQINKEIKTGERKKYEKKERKASASKILCIIVMTCTEPPFFSTNYI